MVTPPAMTAAGCVALYSCSSLARLVVTRLLGRLGFAPDRTAGPSSSSDSGLLLRHLELLCFNPCSAASIFCFASIPDRICWSKTSRQFDWYGAARSDSVLTPIFPGREAAAKSIGVLTP